MSALFSIRDIIHRQTLRSRLCFRTPHIALVISLTFLAPAVFAQAAVPQWCRALPRPEYKTLRRVPVSDAWFEV